MPEPFRKIEGRAVVLQRDNVDTDVIIRVERMANRGSATLKKFAFEALRYDAAGEIDPANPFDRDGVQNAPFLIAGKNFGCGSSREPAVWAVAALGIRCIIAPSFGDIFAGNCFQNGILPIVMQTAVVDALMMAALGGSRITVDLVRCVIGSWNGAEYPFIVDARRREDLLEGLDEIGSTLKAMETIEAWQAADAIVRPWIWQTIEAPRSV